MATLSVGDPLPPPPKPEFTFPSEFPYEFDSSPETDSSGEDEDDFFAGLTRRLTQNLSFKSAEKNRVVAGSPESTLNGLGSLSVSSNGSPNGASSPTTTTTNTAPFGAENDTWDLIYAAAGQVARLKMNAGTRNPPSGPVYSLGPPMAQYQQLRQEQAGAARKGQWPSVWERQQQQQQQVKAAANWQKLHPPPAPQISCGKGGVGGYEAGRFVARTPQSGWPPLQTGRHQHQQLNQTVASSNLGTMAPAAAFVGAGYGVGAKRECAGTGVFLPRRFSNPPADFKKKPTSACPTVVLPAKVVHALNLNLGETAGYSNGPCQPRFNASFAADYAALLARRNAVLAQQKRALQRPEGGFVSHEIGGLPQEWTY